MLMIESYHAVVQKTFFSRNGSLYALVAQPENTQVCAYSWLGVSNI